MEAWIEKQPSMDVIYVPYNELLQHPLEYAKPVNEFLGSRLDTEAMVKIVNPALYRQRK